MILPGLVSITFRKLSPTEIVDLVHRAGLTGIEWGGDVHVPHGDVTKAAAVQKLTIDAGLQIAAYGSYYRCGSADLDFEKVLESAVALGAPTIRVWAGNKGSAESLPEERALVVKDLARITQLAESAGVSISLEFHGNTLTDTNESAVQLLTEVPQPNLFTYWQPHNGAETDLCIAGLRQVTHRLSNLHVFHWWPSGAERHPLTNGEERWMAFLAEVPKNRDRFALLEFVKGDEPAAFLQDAAVLKRWLDSTN